ncbi:hypothetical protein niasHS_006251 [Heterodera schachtii]|uniref:Fido domain-containing protein n=1 Tax=Heterodera schachtii TaxID=97005 RepID=A0ABD2JSU2_HETSC
MQTGYSEEEIDAMLGEVRLNTNPLVLQQQPPHESLEQNEPEADNGRDEDTLSAFGDDERHLEILDIVGTVEAFSVEHLNAIHAKIMEGQPSAGEIRTADVNIIDRDGNVIYQPPPHSHVLQLMSDFCANLNEAMNSVRRGSTEALAVAGWAHHQLHLNAIHAKIMAEHPSAGKIRNRDVNIIDSDGSVIYRPPPSPSHVLQLMVWVHPWTNANGRSSRVVMNSVMMRAGLNTLVLQQQARRNYDDFLQSANLGDISFEQINLKMTGRQSEAQQKPFTEESTIADGRTDN